MAGVFAAAMSTLSSSLSSSATAFVTDFYKPLFQPHADEAHYLRVGKWMTVFWGMVQMGVAFIGLRLTQSDNSSVVGSVLAIANFTSGIVLGVFFLGRLTRSVGPKSALIGLVTGAVVMTYIWQFQRIAWPWYSLIGSSVTFAAGWLTSRVLKDAPVQGDGAADST